jgi:hypothetical protein
MSLKRPASIIGLKLRQIAAFVLKGIYVINKPEFQVCLLLTTRPTYCHFYSNHHFISFLEQSLQLFDSLNSIPGIKLTVHECLKNSASWFSCRKYVACQEILTEMSTIRKDNFINKKLQTNIIVRRLKYLKPVTALLQ